jgi:hypothetical protein
MEGSCHFEEYLHHAISFSEKVVHYMKEGVHHIEEHVWVEKREEHHEKVVVVEEHRGGGR